MPSSPPSSSVGLERRDRAARRRLAPCRLDVVHRESDVVDAVAVLADVLGDLAVGGQRRGEHETDVVLDHDVAGPVADLGLEAAERDRGEAPQGAVVGGRLAGVADPELDVVDALERQEVGGLGVRVRVDPGARLVGGAARDDLCHQQVSAAVGVGRSAVRRAAGGLGRQCYARRATLATWTTCSTDSRRHAAGWPPPVLRWRPAHPGRWPRSTTIRMRRAGGRARSSPTSPRWRSTGRARSSACWTAGPTRCRSAGSRQIRSGSGSSGATGRSRHGCCTTGSRMRSAGSIDAGEP